MDHPDTQLTPSQMYREAQKHGDRYLLMKRFRRGDLQKDALYETAGWLVDNGYARWIDSGSTFAPGIRLTGKPFVIAAQGRS